MATCVVSGTVKDITDTAVSGATIRATPVGPFLASTTLIVPKRVSTTSAADGTWSLTLQETATSSTSVVIEIEYSDGGSGIIKSVYSITVPNQASANFSSLI